MSKQQPAIERAGIPTPKNLAHQPQEGNTPARSFDSFTRILGRAVEDHALLPTQTATEAFGWLAALQAVIKDIAQDGLVVSANGAGRERIALVRIANLAALAKYVADDIGNHVDCEREELQDERLPAALQLLPIGGAA